MPSASWTRVAREFGVSRGPLPTTKTALGSSGPAENIPRGRRYLKERATTRTPLARSAEATVSPAKAVMAFPLKEKARGCSRLTRPPSGRRKEAADSIGSVFCLGRELCHKKAENWRCGRGNFHPPPNSRARASASVFCRMRTSSAFSRLSSCSQSPMLSRSSASKKSMCAGAAFSAGI